MLLYRMTLQYRDRKKIIGSGENGAGNMVLCGRDTSVDSQSEYSCGLTLAAFAAFLVPTHWFFVIYVGSMSYPKSFPKTLFSLFSLW